MRTDGLKIDDENLVVLECDALLVLIAKALVESDLRSATEENQGKEKEGGHDNGSGASGIPADSVR